MKVLFVTSRFPFPLEKGDKLRAYNFVKCLSEQHEVHLFALSENEPEMAAIHELEKYCKSVTVVRLSKFQIVLNLLCALFSKLPFQVAYFSFENAAKKLAFSAQQIRPDVAFFHLIRTAEYANAVDEIPKAIDYMDTFSVGVKRRLQTESFFTRWFWKWEYKKLLRYEASVFNTFQAHTIISEQDKNHLPVAQKQSVTVVPNGVAIQPLKHAIKKYDLIFAGNMSYPPNVEAVQFLVKKIMPLVWQKLPNTNVVIAGANPAISVQNLASEKVEITGWVSDISNYYNASKILVAPMLISIGLQNKLLEAMSFAVPCVTSILANNALKAEHGKQIFEAENPNQYAEY
ncbi:MAG TPA: glycosyltransferase, partial [Chitinophagales bacterium]